MTDKQKTVLKVIGVILTPTVILLIILIFLFCFNKYKKKKALKSGDVKKKEELSDKPTSDSQPDGKMDNS